MQLAAHLRRELVGIAGAQADGTLTADDAVAARGRAIDHLIGYQQSVGDGQWMRDQLAQIRGLRADALLTEPEYQRARGLIVTMYLR